MTNINYIIKRCYNWYGTLNIENKLLFLLIKFLNPDTCPEPLPCLRGGITNPNDCDSCICPDGFGGRLCETVAASDVGCIPRRDESIFVNSVEEQCVHSPNYGRGSYDPFSQCNWHLLVHIFKFMVSFLLK